jgi:hypothetical protein
MPSTYFAAAMRLRAQWIDRVPDVPVAMGRFMYTYIAFLYFKLHFYSAEVHDNKTQREVHKKPEFFTKLVPAWEQ